MPRHLRKGNPSGARNANSPNGSGPAAGISVSADCASVAVFEDFSEARRIASRPRPCERSNFARTALIVKNVAGGAAQFRTGGETLSAWGAAFGFSAKASEVSAQAQIETTKTATSPGKPSFSNFWRIVIRLMCRKLSGAAIQLDGLVPRSERIRPNGQQGLIAFALRRANSGTTIEQNCLKMPDRRATLAPVSRCCIRLRFPRGVDDPEKCVPIFRKKNRGITSRRQTSARRDRRAA